MKLDEKVRKIVALLNKACGRPAPLRRSDPVDELVRTILSQNTNDRNSLAAFAVLKKRFKSWDALLNRRAQDIARLIKHAGLANIKAKRIKDVLAEIKTREGRISLASLRGMGIEESSAYLRSLKGVGPKTAACVLLFSFKKPVMPVDTHIFRVTKRLALIGKDINIEEAHRALSKAVPRRLIYDFHLGIIEYGRKVCKAHIPHCGECVLYKLCEFELKRIYKKRICRDS